MDDATKLHLFFQTIGDANRLRIIKFIDKKERSVSEIVEATKLSQPLVSHHLRILKKHNVLETKRNCLFIFYKLKNDKLLDVLGLFAEIAPNIKRKRGFESMFDCPPWWGKFKNRFEK